MEYSRKYAKYMQKYPEYTQKCQHNIQTHVQKMPKNLEKKTAKHNSPHMASKSKVLQQKCSPRTKNYDYGVIVAWGISSAEIYGRAQESAISMVLW